MQFRAPLSLLLLISACDGVTLRSQSVEKAAQRTELATQLQAIAELEADDKRFWNVAFAAQEAELMQLEGVAEQNSSTHAKAMSEQMTKRLQEVKKDMNAEHVAKGNTTTADKPSSPTKNTTVAVSEKKHEHHKSPLAGVKLNLNPKSAADLIPALAMLKAMYDDGKTRIGELNVREKKLKEKFTEKEAVHKSRMETIESRFKNHTLSAEFHTNETRDELRMWKYWEGCRERQHKQFHTSLKIQHGTMSKVKTMIDMYEKTISGKADKQEIKKDLNKVGGGSMPEIVLIQAAWRDTATYCHGALDELRTATDEFKRGSDSAPF